MKARYLWRWRGTTGWAGRGAQQVAAGERSAPRQSCEQNMAYRHGLLVAQQHRKPCHQWPTHPREVAQPSRRRLLYRRGTGAARLRIAAIIGNISALQADAVVR
eukprot:scaffold502_cov115-Isochrysis_galbana.AAC.14